jgi:threonine synthase
VKPITYYNINNKDERVDFRTALLNGMGSKYGLYMVARHDIPILEPDLINSLRTMSYAEIAYQILNPFLGSEFSPPGELKKLLLDVYSEDKILTTVQHVAGRTHIMWLTHGPTYSFKDYAARFFGKALNFFLGQKNLRKVVVVATSGDTGGAVADALYDLENVDNIVFFPKDSISEGQRRQMTTLGSNIYTFEVNGDFDVCQAMAKNLLEDKAFAKEVFGDSDRFTSANSISLGRLLPQAVYPFFAYSRIAGAGEQVIASIPSGNFGDMMGTVIAKQMGLPISKIICGVNENIEFPEFLESGKYKVRPAVKCPSSAMIVSHPSNLARLIDFYGGHMYDDIDPSTKKVLTPGIIDIMPDMAAMQRDLFSVGVKNHEHYDTMKEVYGRYGIVLDPHGAVGWRALDLYLRGNHTLPAVVYETADPGKFPEDVRNAIGVDPEPPAGMKEQASKKERIYRIEAKSEKTSFGLKLSHDQAEEARNKIAQIFRKKN